METNTCKHTHLRGTYTLSSRQQGPVSNHDRPWIRSMLKANDLRHMSSPCGFKTKHCQEHSASLGSLLLTWFSPHAASNTIHQVQDETYHRLFCSVLFCSVLLCSLPLPTAASISAACADLPARLERAPQHPGDGVHSHYPQWEKLLGHC